MSIGDPAHTPRDTEFWLAQSRLPQEPQVKVRTVDLTVPMGILAGAALLLVWMLTTALLG